MKNLVLLAIVVFALLACTRTENGLVFGIPSYEQRSIKVTKMDLTILLQTQQLLASKNQWEHSHSRTCSGLAPYTLYCALEAASIKVDKKYIHRRPALQEVRFTIDDNYKNRWKVHRLADFNNNEKTTYQDIRHVLNITIARVKRKLSNYRN